jgi:hypothetical protein
VVTAESVSRAVGQLEVAWHAIAGDPMRLVARGPRLADHGVAMALPIVIEHAFTLPLPEIL